MSLWEYKVISSGRGGFATPVLLEKFLNDLGRDEWEIVEFRTHPDNPLAFSGLARRSTQRDWTLEGAAAAAAKAEADKLRAEFEAKFKEAADRGAAAGEERAPSFIEEKVAPDDGFRKPVDTSHDADPDADEEEKEDDWDKLTAAEEDDLPTFFEAIKPHMRRNQRGPGMSVGVEYLAKKWDLSEDDLNGALVECGFDLPEDEDATPQYVEYDGDLYWLNVNRRGELWINTREKPRPVFRPVKAQRVAGEAERPPKENGGKKPEFSEQKSETAERESASAETPAANLDMDDAATPEEAPGRGPKSEGAVPLPQGAALLDRIRRHMRRNRRGPGGSGSASFLSRALKCREADLAAAFMGLGLTIPASPGDKPVYVEIGNEVWWLNIDSRGGLWINGRERKPGEAITPEAAPGEQPPLEPAAGTPVPEMAETVESAPNGTPDVTEASAAPGASVTEAQPPESAAAADAPEPVPPMAEVPEPEPVMVEPAVDSTTSAGPESMAGTVLTGARLLLQETRTGSFAGRIERLADEIGKSPDEFIAALVGAGLKVPEKPREKPVFVEHAGEIFWFSKNAKGELWLNAKASKFADDKEDAGAPVEGGEESDGGDRGDMDPDKRPRRSRAKKKPGEPSAEQAAPGESEVTSETVTPTQGGAL